MPTIELTDEELIAVVGMHHTMMQKHCEEIRKRTIAPLDTEGIQSQLNNLCHRRDRVAKLLEINSVVTPAPTPAPQGDPGILVDAINAASEILGERDMVGGALILTLGEYRASVPPPAPDAPDHARVRLLEEVARSARDWVSNDQINRLTGGTRAFSEMDEARNATKRALEDLAALEALNG